MGKPNTGKSTSLMNLENQERYVYLNSDMKDLPFKDKFMKNVKISNALDIIPFITEIEKNPDVDGVVLDTLTFLMSMYERQHVITAADTRAAWGNYGNFYRDIIHAIKAGTKNYIILAHEDTELNPQTMQLETKIPLKGAVGKLGVNTLCATIQ